MKSVIKKRGTGFNIKIYFEKKSKGSYALKSREGRETSHRRLKSRRKQSNNRKFERNKQLNKNKG